MMAEEHTEQQLTPEVVVVDELAQLEAVDPTFGGIREDPALVRAYDAVVAALAKAHQERFRYALPEDSIAVFEDLANEVHLPHEQLIQKLLHSKREHQSLGTEEVGAILEVVDDFLHKIKRLE